MTKSVATPEERASEIVFGAERAMMERVHAAVAEATTRVRDDLREAGLDLPPTPRDYFRSVVHQSMYAALCRADEESFQGGDPVVAIAIIRNQQMIANHYWGAAIDVTPKASTRG